MTLAEVISDYLSEKFQFFKYVDTFGNEIKVQMVFSSHLDFYNQYIKYYTEHPSLPSLLDDATQGNIKITQTGNKVYYIRHPHQEVFTDKKGNTRGVSKEITSMVRDNLLKRIGDLERCSNFEQILVIVEQCKVKGFGDLSIYDTSVRIGAYLGIAPDRVYLHAGTREGIKCLEEKGYLQDGSSKRKSIALSEMPSEFDGLPADIVQNIACAKKDDFKENLDISRRIFN